MQCPRCQAKNDDGARFCEDCGTRFELACPSCGQPVGIGKKFCRSCGAQLATESGRFGPPESYTPTHLVERILTSKAALEGERKQVTVLFADLKGSMELLADRDPEEARKLLDPVLEHMMEAVHRYEGTVNQVMGDGIMALFGAPVAHEDHAVRACYAALRMQESVRRSGQETHRTLDVPIHIRIGLNSGEVIVRSIGSDLHMDYTAVGQTTHLAARMEQMAMPGSVLMPASTLKLVEGYVEVRALGARTVKGLDSPVDVYEITGPGPARARFAVAAARGLSPFVGRESHLEQLRRGLDLTRSGRGQVLAVVGEPGVGKSRILWEFLHSDATAGWRMLQTGCTSYGKATPYLAVVDVLKAYFALDPRDDPATVREKVSGKLLALDRALVPTLPALLSLLDVPIEDVDWERLDPPQRRRRTLDALKGLVLREGHVQPVLVVFEDLQWIDSETQAFLDSLVESLPTARLMLLVNYRPEYEHRWGRKTYYTQIRLDPLSRKNAEDLFDALVGADLSLRPLKHLLVERTEGNPFFLEESVRSLVETRTLAGGRAAYRLVKPIEVVGVPATVQSVLAARIDRLPPSEKRLLHEAAVIGKNVPFALLRAITEVPGDELRRGVSRLQAAEFLYETSLFPHLEYTFKHALTHEVAYRSLLQEPRRVLHTHVVEAIELLFADRLTEQLDQLAHHALRGEAWEKALTYLSQAGAKAAARCANREAVSCFEDALVALQHLPQTPDVLEHAIDLRFNLRNAFLQLGEPARLINYLREAQTLARALGDKRRLGRVFASMAHYFWLNGEHDSALESGQHALEIAADLGDLPLEVTTNYYLGLAYHSLGDYCRGAEILRKNIESLVGDLLHERFGTAGSHAVFARGWLICCLAELGDFIEAGVRGEEGMRIAEAVNDPFSLVQAYLGIGSLHLRTGEFDRAIAALERALALSRMADIRVLIPRVAASLGHAYTLLGRIVEALPLLEHAVEQAFSMPVIFMHASALAWLSEAHLVAGRVDDAMDDAQRALTHARHHKERGHEAWILRLLAEISALADRSHMEEADDYYRQAIALAKELGMRPLVAHCHLGLGTLRGRTRRTQETGQHLAAAVALFGEMNMRFWLERAKEERVRLP